MPATAAEPYEVTLDIAFPTVASAYFTHDYHQDRSGGARKHKATDVMAPKHSPAYAVVDGTICYINGIDEPMPSWGYSVSVPWDLYWATSSDTPLGQGCCSGRCGGTNGTSSAATSSGCCAIWRGCWCRSPDAIRVRRPAVAPLPDCIRANRVGGRVTPAALPHHRTCGSAYGGS